MLGSLFHFWGDMLGDIWAYFGNVFGWFWGGFEKKFGRGRKMLKKTTFSNVSGSIFPTSGDLKQVVLAYPRGKYKKIWIFYFLYFISTYYELPWGPAAGGEAHRILRMHRAFHGYLLSHRHSADLRHAMDLHRTMLAA